MKEVLALIHVSCMQNKINGKLKSVLLKTKERNLSVFTSYDPDWQCLVVVMEVLSGDVEENEQVMTGAMAIH